MKPFCKNLRLVINKYSCGIHGHFSYVDYSDNYSLLGGRVNKFWIVVVKGKKLHENLWYKILYKSLTDPGVRLRFVVGIGLGAINF